MEIIGIYLFVIGCCIGSFINVLIYRLPLNQSIVYPNSSCPECNAKIKWFDNLPIISWLLLRGKCRACKSKISFSYPIIELSTGLLVWLNFYANPTIYSQLAEPIILFCGTILSSILITLAILDFKYFWLPQAITIGGLMLGITSSLIIDLSNDFGQFSYSLYSITASLLGLALFYLLSYLGFKIFNKPEIGEITIKGCYDGDTCTSSEGEKIRLACIDTPEIRGKRAKPNEAIAAKNFLNEKIKGKKVSVRRVTEDKYGRTVGELSFNGENIQELLVKEGHAEIYKKYSKPCKWAS